MIFILSFRLTWSYGFCFSHKKHTNRTKAFNVDHDVGDSYSDCHCLRRAFYSTPSLAGNTVSSCIFLFLPVCTCECLECSFCSIFLKNSIFYFLSDWECGINVCIHSYTPNLKKKLRKYVCSYISYIMYYKCW